MVKVLVTDGGYSHSLAIIRSLSKLGHCVDCIGHPYCLSSLSKNINKCSYKQKYFNERYIDKFLTFLDCENYDFLIPIGGQSVKFINKYRTEISKKVIINLAPYKSIEKCLDKNKLLKLATELEIPTPKIYESDEILNLNLSKYSFPRKFVIKPSSELSNSKVVYTSDINLIKDFLDNEEDLLFQDFINGCGVGFFAIYDNGILKNFFMHKRIRENPPSGGSSVCAESISDERLYKYGKKILDTLNWHGVAMVEFKKEYKTNKLFLMEVNPKFWGSHDLAISSGINFAEEYLEINPYSRKIEKAREFQIEFVLNKRFQWLARDISSSFLRPIRLFKVLYNFSILKVDNNLYLSDPLCTIYLLAYAFFAPIAKSKLSQNIYNFLSRIKNNGLKICLIRYFTEISGIPILKFSKVTNHIAVGAAPSRFGLFFLSIMGYKYILNLMHEFRNNEKKNALLNFYNIPVKEFTSPSLSQLEEGSNYIQRVILTNNKIYIHCREGISRAPCFLAAYLIKYKNLNYVEAIDFIKNKRIFINILPNQIKILKNFEENLKIK